MSVPGAPMSGLIAKSVNRGPRDEPSAIASAFVRLATASAASAAAGLDTLRREPELPAATTNSAPVSAVSRFTACDSGSEPSDCSPPRLMLTTRAPTSREAHSMPAMTSLSRQPPWSHTLPTARLACLATPVYLPPDAVPRPAAIDATCVPWPSVSRTPAGEPVKSFDALTAPARSGCPAS
jgi:hypothetical protein